MIVENILLKELKLNGNVLSILLTNTEVTPDRPKGDRCTLSLLKRAVQGETLCFDGGRMSCPGAARGMGFFDGIPNIKGGFGNFLSKGAGEGCPEGERVKITPETGEEMINIQPTNVLDGFKYIVVKPYDEADNPVLITIFCTPDQLSCLIQLFSYRTGAYDNVIAPLCSGCASIFRIPLGELKKDNPRAVIGNVDTVARVHFHKDSFFFTVPAKTFREMLQDADSSFLVTSEWNNLKKRL